ncbi:MAG: hypothetical protein V3T17_14685 [Pseudomonadales bacterium]
MTKQPNTEARILSMLILTFVLSACGGGGSSSPDSSNSNQNTSEETPTDNEWTQTNTSAATSLDLKINSTFDFSHHNLIEFAVDAKDPNGNLLTNRSISIYRIPDDIDEWNDEYLDSAELLLRGKIDNAGVFLHQLELPGSVHQVLITLSYIGIENKVLVPIQGNRVAYSFR